MLSLKQEKSWGDPNFWGGDTNFQLLVTSSWGISTNSGLVFQLPFKTINNTAWKSLKHP